MFSWTSVAVLTTVLASSAYLLYRDFVKPFFFKSYKVREEMVTYLSESETLPKNILFSQRIISYIRSKSFSVSLIKMEAMWNSNGNKI